MINVQLSSIFLPLGVDCGDFLRNHSLYGYPVTDFLELCCKLICFHETSRPHKSDITDVNAAVIHRLRCPRLGKTQMFIPARVCGAPFCVTPRLIDDPHN